MAKLVKRVPNPVTSMQQAYRNRRSVCEPRGHCGPFINEFYYRAFPGWEGFGDCTVCGSTVHTAEHLLQSIRIAVTFAATGDDTAIRPAFWQARRTPSHRGSSDLA
jgi:hypothetical protein